MNASISRDASGVKHPRLLALAPFSGLLPSLLAAAPAAAPFAVPPEPPPGPATAHLVAPAPHAPYAPPVEKYFPTENRLIKEAARTLSGAAFKVYQTIVCVSERRTGICHTGPRKLANLSGCGLSTVRGALRELDERGFIQLLPQQPCRGEDAHGNEVYQQLPTQCRLLASSGWVMRPRFPRRPRQEKGEPGERFEERLAAWESRCEGIRNELKSQICPPPAQIEREGAQLEQEATQAEREGAQTGHGTQDTFAKTSFSTPIHQGARAQKTRGKPQPRAAEVMVDGVNQEIETTIAALMAFGFSEERHARALALLDAEAPERCRAWLAYAQVQRNPLGPGLITARVRERAWPQGYVREAEREAHEARRQEERLAQEESRRQSEAARQKRDQASQEEQRKRENAEAGLDAGFAALPEPEQRAIDAAILSEPGREFLAQRLRDPQRRDKPGVQSELARLRRKYLQSGQVPPLVETQASLVEAEVELPPVAPPHRRDPLAEYFHASGFLPAARPGA